MPAPRKISKTLRAALKEQLELSSGIKLDQNYKCAELKSYLTKKRNINISESTLRRLFGFVKSTESASIYTLNLLASAVGHSSWEQFQNSISTPDMHTFNMQLIQGLDKNIISNKKITPQLKQLNFSSWTSAYQLYILIDTAIRKEDKAILNEILELPIEHIDKTAEDMLYFALQPISIHADQNNKFIINWVKGRIRYSKILQDYVLLGNVFDNKLLDFYGTWLLSMTGINKSSMQVFKSILLCHMYYLKNEKTLAKKFFNKAKKWDESSNNSTPPIVRGRLAAWEYIIWGKLDLLKKYYLQESNVISKIETLEFAAKLIWQHKDQRIVLPFINEFDLAQLPTLTNFYQKGRADVMKLIMAINFLNTAKTKQAKTLVAEINPSNFHYSDRKWLQEKYQQVIRA